MRCRFEEIRCEFDVDIKNIIDNKYYCRYHRLLFIAKEVFWL